MRLAPTPSAALALSGPRPYPLSPTIPAPQSHCHPAARTHFQVQLPPTKPCAQLTHSQPRVTLLHTRMPTYQHQQQNASCQRCILQHMHV